MDDDQSLQARFLACPADLAAVDRLFKDLHARYFSRLVRFIAHASSALRGLPDVCEELALESFVKLWKYRASYRGDCALFTYLCQIATNLVLSYLRAQRGKPELPLEPASDDDATAPSLADRASRDDWLAHGDAQQCGIDERRVAACVQQRLREHEARHPEHVAVLRMQYFAELKGPEIARAIGRTEGATREFLRQARIIARKALSDCWALVNGGAP